MTRWAIISRPCGTDRRHVTPNSFLAFPGSSVHKRTGRVGVPLLCLALQVRYEQRRWRQMNGNMAQLQDHEYEYKARWSAILLGVLLCGAGATVAAALAGSNRGLIIHGIKLSPEMAACFWLSMTILALGGVLLFLLMAFHRLIRTQRIVLTPTAIIVPKGRFSSKMVIIPFSTITDLSVSKVSSQRFLKITHQCGATTIASSFLPMKTDFQSIFHALAERVEGERSVARDGG